MKELTELKNEFYEVMYRYEKSFSEEGVMANLTAWQTAKADLLSLLRRHPNWNEDEQAIIFDCNQALSIHPDMVDETAFTLLDIASEILSGEQLEDFRTALHAAVSGYYHSHRPAVNPVGSRTFWDYIILNSDILLGLLFLLASAIPFILVFDKKKPQARELVPIAVMAAIGVVGRTVFEIIPLPNFKPCSAIIIITAVAFGPEAGFLTGALTAFVSNFIFGQGPWTPWQMFTWGLVGFLAGILQNAGVFKGRSRRHFAAQWWDRLCPENTNRGDLLHFVRQLTDHAPLRLCLYGFLSGFLYGWIMNLYFIIGYVSPLTWQTIGAAYLSSFFFDFCHGLCTFLVLWALGDPWVRKLERIKIKFGLTAEERNYVLPPSTFEIARENYE